MSNKVEVKELLEAGVHFGHMTRKWDPNMAPYIYISNSFFVATKKLFGLIGMEMDKLDFMVYHIW